MNVELEINNLKLIVDLQSKRLDHGELSNRLLMEQIKLIRSHCESILIKCDFAVNENTRLIQETAKEALKTVDEIKLQLESHLGTKLKVLK